jgi:hypothetical protein
MPNVTPPPVPTQSQVVNNQGLATRPWIAWFTTLGQIFGFNQTIESDGTALPQEIALNFSSDFVVTDNPANGSTDVALPPASYKLQRGTALVNATGSDYASLAVAFPVAFSAIPQVFLNPTVGPRGVNAPMSSYATNITTLGFIINLACSVPTGGGGATVDQQIPVNWVALG